MCETDVAYGSGPNQTLDVYYPTGRSHEPSVIMIHGGGWMAGESIDFGPEAVYYAQNGFAVFSINYTLSTPQVPDWPQVETDVETATDWVAANASSYGADGSRIGAFGGSAGAHLAALLDTAGRLDGHPIEAAVSYSGPMDLPLDYQYGNAYVKLAITQLLGCSPGDCTNGEDLAASPIDNIAADDGPLLFFNSANELVPIESQRAMNQALDAAGVPHRMSILKHTHLHANGYECLSTKVLGERLPTIDNSIRWLSKYLRGRAGQTTGTYCQ